MYIQISCNLSEACSSSIPNTEDADSSHDRITNLEGKGLIVVHDPYHLYDKPCGVPRKAEIETDYSRSNLSL